MVVASALTKSDTSIQGSVYSMVRLDDACVLLDIVQDVPEFLMALKYLQPSQRSIAVPAQSTSTHPSTSKHLHSKAEVVGWADPQCTLGPKQDNLQKTLF